MPISQRLDDYDFQLPPELIAQHPAGERSRSRLLHAGGKTIADRQFAELPQLLRKGDLLVVNDTRVIKARFLGRKASGGKIEVLVERIIDGRQAIAQIRASKSPGAGTTLQLEERFECVVTGRNGEFFTLALAEGDPASFWDHCEHCGRLPLPPYITHPAAAADESRYQTVYAREPGAVAAPTAGLHFDDELFAALAAAGIGCASLTLHVGAGTFQPVRLDDLARHRMDEERYEIPEAVVSGG